MDPGYILQVAANGNGSGKMGLGSDIEFKAIARFLAQAPGRMWMAGGGAGWSTSHEPGLELVLTGTAVFFHPHK